MRIFRILTNAAALLWFLYVLDGVTDAGISVLQMLAKYYGAPVVLILWALNLGVYMLRGSGDRVRRLLGIVVAPSLVVLIFLADRAYPVPLRWRLEASAAALERTGNDTWEHPKIVGLFIVYQKTIVGTELRFNTAQCFVLDECGLVFSPDGPPRRVGEDSFMPLAGSWWLWRDSW